MHVLLVRDSERRVLKECLPSANLGYIAGLLKSEGHKVKAVDLRLDKVKPDYSKYGLVVLETKKTKKAHKNLIIISPDVSVPDALRLVGKFRKIPFPDWSVFKVKEYRGLFTGERVSELPVFIEDRSEPDILSEVRENKKRFHSKSLVLLGSPSEKKLSSLCKELAKEKLDWKLNTTHFPSPFLSRVLKQGGCTHIIIHTDKPNPWSTAELERDGIKVDINFSAEKCPIDKLLKFASKTSADYLAVRGPRWKVYLAYLVFYLRPSRLSTLTKSVGR
jgi:hypothetical protein